MVLARQRAHVRAGARSSLPSLPRHRPRERAQTARASRLLPRGTVDAICLAWIEHDSATVSALAEAGVARRVLDQATGRLDGKNAAASTARRHRTIQANAMD